jgi:hypothetical protein
MAKGSLAKKAINNVLKAAAIAVPAAMPSLTV